MLKKVLVVDDSALIHQMYKMVLMRYRCEIIDAMNGQDGLDKLSTNPDVSLILLDINMPVMNGIEFIKKVMAVEAYNTIPIVMVSTEGKEEDTLRGLALGAKGYVKKPFQPSDLHAIIEKIYPSK
ncbi:MAG: histidine kinase [Nitrospirae bacterium GWD2_57_9]|nr:MAG: histidine kinase [Nitrospirae bacterium GWD2_57_9]